MRIMRTSEGPFPRLIFLSVFLYIFVLKWTGFLYKNDFDFSLQSAMIIFKFNG